MVWSMTADRPGVARVGRPVESPLGSLAGPTPGPAHERGEAGSPRRSGLERRVNLNTAGAAELELLPGIGPAMARRIIEHRGAHGPFRSMSDLDAVSGIGPAKLAKIEPLVSFE
ncbi:MAG: helix-hairpin-helix domain-containing protein [Phycisphaerae bacterium]|nr:helix-hairpin-helix domain-containing protein [Phycisphaerae bacterium]